LLFRIECHLGRKYRHQGVDGLSITVDDKMVSSYCGISIAIKLLEVSVDMWSGIRAIECCS
jgi:hypothetical protein